ncbi:MAG: general secretion pathway protein GspK [Armatimonadetes bacterium]|nr:general secretion pathway protein GspK [Armatimonadota bacterium]
MKRRGTVFILALLTVVALTAVVASMSISQRSAVLSRLRRVEMIRAERIAEAGIQRAIAELSTRTTGPVLTTDSWATLGNNGDDRFVVGADSFRIQVIDASSLVNINNAPEEQLQRMPLTQEEIDSILDYRSAGETPRATGAKDDYYNALTTPYNAKLLPFETPDELLQVRGMTPKTLYQPQENVSGTTLVGGTADSQPALIDLITTDSTCSQVDTAGTQKRNINTANQQAIQQVVGSAQVATQIFQRRQTTPFTTMGQVLQVPGVTTQIAKSLLDNFQIGNGAVQTGKINLNTATEAVLNTIPNLPADLVQTILSRQSQGFQSLGEIMDLPGFSVQVAQQTVDQFSVTSDTFLVRVVGTAGSSKVTLIGVVTFRNNIPTLIRIEHPAESNVSASRWGWNDETTSDTVLKENS